MRSALSSITRSLKHRNYRIYFIGQIVSLTGTWITSVASGWLIYRLTSSPFLLAAVQGCALLPSLVLAPLAGVIVDRKDKRSVIMCTQAASMLQSFTLAFLALTNTITIPQIFVLVVIQGIVNAFDMPTRQAFLNEIVTDKADLSNAIALNSAIFNGARLVGPAIGGAVIAMTNEGMCFLIDGFSYLAVLLALTKMRIDKVERQVSDRSVFTDLKEGLLYAIRFEPVGGLILFVAVTSFSIAPYTVMMPAFARDHFAGGPDTLGYLMSANGAGALAGAIYLASRKSILGLGDVIRYAGVAAGTGIVLFAFNSIFTAALLILFVIGLSIILLVASCNTVLQTIIEPSKRGRVLSLFTTAFMGMMPLGSLFAGFISKLVGISVTVAFGGVMILCASAIFAKRLPHIKTKARPIYVEKGILRGE